AATPQAGVQAAGGQTAGGQASAATAGQASASGPTAPGAGPAAAQGPVPAIAQGARMPLRILSIIQPPPQGTAAPPTFPAPGTTPPIPGQAITAIIGGTTAQGRPIAQTAFGPVALATKAPLAQGTQVRMEVAGQAEMPESNRPAPPPARPLGLFNAREWPALQEAVDTIRAADPAALQHLTTRAVPQANPQFSAGVLFFLSALRGGDFAGWLGNDAMRILQQTRPNLAARLGDEFQGIGAMSREPLVGDWRLALIPFFNGPDLEPLRLYLKPYGEEEEEDENKGVRFIIDVKLSRLGRVQLDGLVRDEQKRLDLIIRSEIPFEADMQNDIRTIFEDANEATGIKGGLTFQASPPGFMEIPAEGKGGSDSDVIA
ncbi:MAG: hypothetical protein MI741_13840, partial [Rhodospirillales bacterium]|nr:hypothetical protein [Rhodospirillales bacterium]